MNIYVDTIFQLEDTLKSYCMYHFVDGIFEALKLDDILELMNN